MRFIDKICNILAVLAGIYLVMIMFATVIVATIRSLLKPVLHAVQDGYLPEFFFTFIVYINNFPGFKHIFTFSEYGLLYIVMAASPWLVRIRGHVFIEMLTAALPSGPARIYSRLIAVLCLVICLFLVWYSGFNTLKAYNYGDADMRSLDMPKWLLLISMPICFSLMALNFIRFIFGSETMHTGEAGVHE